MLKKQIATIFSTIMEKSITDRNKRISFLCNLSENEVIVKCLFYC